MKPIFTAGYGGHPARSLILAAREMDALVLDIRHTPRSKAPGYDQKELKSTLDSRYFHVPDLGNLNYANGGAIKLANAKRGIPWVLRLAALHSVILLCGCGQFESCHRAVVSQRLAGLGIKTQELAWPDVPRINWDAVPDIVLSIKQPWAWLIVNGYKDIENRSWSSEPKGRILIHAGKEFDKDAHRYFMEDAGWRRLMPKLGDFDRGGVVGVATMTGCVQDSTSPWFFGPYGFELQNAQPLPFMALPGALGFFSVRKQLAAERARKVGKAAREAFSAN